MDILDRMLKFGRERGIDTLLLCAVFLISCSVLLFEILSFRAARIAFGHDTQFIIIPLTLLGISLGSALALLRNANASRVHVLSAIGGFVVSAAAQFLIVGEVARLGATLSALCFLCCALLSYSCAGWVLTSVFRTHYDDAPFIYATDLLGASFGACVSVSLMNRVGYEQTVLYALIIASTPILFFSRSDQYRYRITISVLVVLATLASITTPAYKLFSVPCLAASTPLYHATNAFSQLDARAIDLSATRFELGQDPETISVSSNGFIVYGDCTSFSALLISAPSFSDTAFLRDSLRSIPFDFAQQRTGRELRVLIPSAGPGIDVMRARLFETSRVDVTEFNPLMIEFSKQFSAPATYPYTQENVHLFVDDSRRFIETTGASYDVILLAKPGLYGAVPTESGSATYAATIEANRAYLQHLSDDGILASVGFNAERTLVVITSAMQQLGIEPSDHIRIVRGEKGFDDMVIASRSRFNTDDIAALTTVAQTRGFTVSVPDASVPAIDIGGSDDKPYAFRPGSGFFSDAYRLRVLAITTILAALVITACAYGVTSWYFKEKAAGVWSLYFAAIGFGFVFFELGAIDRLFYLVPEPLYSAAITVGSFLFFAGLGSLITGRIPSQLSRLTLLVSTLLLCAYCTAGYLFDLEMLTHALHFSRAARVMTAITLIAVPSFCMGLFVPYGFRAAGRISDRLIPVVWCLDGVLGVLAGVTSKTVMPLVGIHTMYPTVAGLYIVAVICFLFATHISSHARPI